MQGHSRRLKSFVANRKADIQRKSDPAQWPYIPGKQNPADDATRGLDLKNLSTESRWFQGSAFLRHGETSWPLESRLWSDYSEEGKQEMAKISLVSMQAVPASVWHREVFFLAPIVRSYSLDREIHFQK